MTQYAIQDYWKIVGNSDFTSFSFQFLFLKLLLKVKSKCRTLDTLYICLHLSLQRSLLL